MSSPLVSICVPCFNAEAYVGAAIESILAQTYAPIEVIVVDDGSSDRSAAIIASYHASGVRLVSANRKGASAARNLAFTQASGSFVLFMDADDLMGPDHVALLVASLNGASRRIAFGCWTRFTDKPAGPPPIVPDHYQDMGGPDWLCFDWIGGRPMLQCGMFLIPRLLLEEHGGWDERLSLIDDLEFFARIISKSDGMAYAPGACLYYRSGIPGSLSRQVSRQAYESAVMSCLLASAHLLAVQDSPSSRQACANLLQGFDYHFYPIPSDLRKQVLARISDLGGSKLEPEGPPVFHLLRRLIGWRAARRFQKLAHGLGQILVVFHAWLIKRTV